MSIREIVQARLRCTGWCPAVWVAPLRVGTRCQSTLHIGIPFLRQVDQLQFVDQQCVGGKVRVCLAFIIRQVGRYDDGPSSANSHAEQPVFNSCVAVTPTNSDWVRGVRVRGKQHIAFASRTNAMADSEIAGHTWSSRTNFVVGNLEAAWRLHSSVGERRTSRGTES